MDTLYGDVAHLGIYLAGDPRSIGHSAADLVCGLSHDCGRHCHVHPSHRDAPAGEDRSANGRLDNPAWRDAIRDELQFCLCR